MRHTGARTMRTRLAPAHVLLAAVLVLLSGCAAVVGRAGDQFAGQLRSAV